MTKELDFLGTLGVETERLERNMFMKERLLSVFSFCSFAFPVLLDAAVAGVGTGVGAGDGAGEGIAVTTGIDADLCLY